MLAATIAAGAALWPLPDVAVRFSAKTILVVPGNANPDGTGINAKLNGYFDPGQANFGFPGYDARDRDSAEEDSGTTEKPSRETRPRATESEPSKDTGRRDSVRARFETARESKRINTAEAA